MLNTLRLLGIDYLLDTSIGFLVDVSVDWSCAVSYWVHPVLYVLRPLPATVLLPITFHLFPSSYSTAAFLIALTTGLPVTVLTWSSVTGVGKSYYDVARTPGASNALLALRMVIPTVLSRALVRLFMGLGASFTVLVATEMMGVKSGLGQYLT